MPYIGLWGLVFVSFCDNAGITVPEVCVAMVAFFARVLMPRRCALSAWNRRPNVLSTLLPVALAFGTIVPGSPNLLYPATDRKSNWPFGPPTRTLEPAMLPPPA